MSYDTLVMSFSLLLVTSCFFSSEGVCVDLQDL